MIWFNQSLLVRLEKMTGNTDVTLQEFRDYLSSRLQTVSANGLISQFSTLLMRMPQGLNIGPLLCIMNFAYAVNIIPVSLQGELCGSVGRVSANHISIPAFIPGAGT